MTKEKQTRRDDGSIFRHPDGKRWFARLQYIDANGRRTQKKRICQTHEAAKRMLGQLRDEIENDAADRHTFGDLERHYRREYLHAARFVGDKKLSGFRQNLSTVRYLLDRALEFFGSETYLDTIDYERVREYKFYIADLKTIHGGDRSVSDINHHLKRVRQLFTVAVELGWLSLSPFKRGRPLIIEAHENERTRILSQGEETKLLSKCEKRRKHLGPIIIFAIETGLRAGEIKSLKWSDVTLNGRCVKIQSLNSKTLKSRLVPLSARAADVLAQLRQNSGRRQLVFGMSAFRKSFRHACDEAGLSDVNFHDLRHTAITRMLEKGISPPLVMKISGHTQQKTFLRYVNQSEGSVLEIAKLLDRAA